MLLIKYSFIFVVWGSLYLSFSCWLFSADRILYSFSASLCRIATGHLCYLKRLSCYPVLNFVIVLFLTVNHMLIWFSYKNLLRVKLFLRIRILANSRKPVRKKFSTWGVSIIWESVNGFFLRSSRPWFPCDKKRASKIQETFHIVQEAVTENSFQRSHGKVFHKYIFVKIVLELVTLLKMNIFMYFSRV